MAKKKKAAAKSAKPRSFGGVIRGRSQSVQGIAKALREVVYEELPDAEESFYGGKLPMGMYRTSGDVCWIQPLKECCNIYFTQGSELSDEQGLLLGGSKHRYIKLYSLDDVETLPIRAWLQESEALNVAAVEDGESFDEVHERLQEICLALPNTKETLTWGKPHFRVGEKIFCGCGEEQGRPRVGLKMEKYQSEMMMRIPGIDKAPYSRKGDGWVAIDPNTFDDWDEIEELIVGSFRLIAPKRLVAELDG